MTEILRPQQSDLDAIEQIYTRVHNDEEKGLATTGWIRGVYPIRETAEQALKRDDLFVLKVEGKVVATGIINKIQVDVYKDIGWKHSVPDEEVMVLHTLAVDPLEKGKGANVKHFFTLLGKMFFTLYGKEFFTYPGKKIFTSLRLPVGTGQGASAGRIPRGKSNTWHGAGSGPALQW